LQPKRVLGTFTLAMLTVAAIISLRNLSISAQLGPSAIFYLVLAAIIFFIPLALITAELGSTWPEPGANYVWVSKAFGKKLGFFALWMAWMESIAWFPAILAFSAAMLAHCVAPLIPGLENSNIFVFSVMLLIFWGTTFLNFFSIKISGVFSSVGVILGTLIPGALIIAFGGWWLFSGNPLQVDLTLEALMPDFKMDNLIFFSGILLGLSGVELAAYHIKEAENPQKS